VAEPVTARFTMRRAEYLAGMHVERGPLLRGAVIFGAALVAAGLAAKLEVLTVLGAVALVGGVGGWLLPLWRWTGEPSLGAEETWTATESGCTIVRPASQIRVDWPFYRELVDAGAVWVLLGDRGITDVLPKRAFTSRDDEAAFLEHAKAHVPVREQEAAASTGWTD
jgi:hypothetical protein